jgi:hypothetical protein
MKNPLANKPAGGPMSRKETAVWLGRAMSTTEVNLRVILQLVEVIDFQQRAIQALTEKIVPPQGDGQLLTGALREIDQGATKGILDKLTERRGELGPILKAVDEACRQLEGML